MELNVETTVDWLVELHVVQLVVPIADHHAEKIVEAK